MSSDDLKTLLQIIEMAGRPFGDLHAEIELVDPSASEAETEVLESTLNGKSIQIYDGIRAFCEAPNFDIAEDIRNEIDEFIMLLDNVSNNPVYHIVGVDLFNIVNHRDKIESLLLEIVGQLEELEVPSPPLPESRAAPIQVEVADHRIRLTYTQTRTGTIDYPAANRVRVSLFETFDALVSALPSSSNADSRYIRACQVLRDYLSQDLESVSIEALGLSYQLVEKITRRLSHEMGGTHLDEIEHVLIGVGVLLNQFEEWRTYLTELAKTKLDPENAPRLVEQGQQLIAEMEKPGAPVDPAVVRRLREMVEPVVTGIVSAEAVAVPLVCSLSNVFSLLSQVAIDHATKSHNLIEHAALMGTAAILVDFSVHLIRTFFPVLSQFQPLHFILSVADYLNKRYSQWKDTTSV